MNSVFPDGKRIVGALVFEAVPDPLLERREPMRRLCKNVSNESQTLSAEDFPVVVESSGMSHRLSPGNFFDHAGGIRVAVCIYMVEDEGGFSPKRYKCVRPSPENDERETNSYTYHSPSQRFHIGRRHTTYPLAWTHTIIAPRIC
jgi:hypothetical protein